MNKFSEPYLPIVLPFIAIVDNNFSKKIAKTFPCGDFGAAKSTFSPLKMFRNTSNFLHLGWDQTPYPRAPPPNTPDTLMNFIILVFIKV